MKESMHVALAISALLAMPHALRAQAEQAAEQAAEPATAPGVYSDSQATRGQLWFESACMACHPSRDMSSADFQLKWRGRSAFDLYERIRSTMPQAAPGSLSRRSYTDIVAYLMRINGLPVGTTALSADSLLLRQSILSFATAVPSTLNRQ